MLLATTKLFFKTPGEMQEILGKFFEMVLKNYHDVDLRDRTYFFYNLLKNNVELADFIISGERVVIDEYYDDFEGEALETIYSQFNTLSVIYSKPEEKFVRSNDIENEEQLIKLKLKQEDGAEHVQHGENVDYGSIGAKVNNNNNIMAGVDLIVLLLFTYIGRQLRQYPEQ